ncbi:hypothetical protein LTR17_027052 [Elasticomyces elasticus]|nr:hypothetical protein LTR17_027052 [Elasticomyces elasticus]
MDSLPQVGVNEVYSFFRKMAAFFTSLYQGIRTLGRIITFRPNSDSGKRLTETFELLEHVLLILPVKDVLFAQRVNRTFQSTIANSKGLQQRLFLVPVPAPFGQYPQPTFNPLLLKYSTVGDRSLRLINCLRRTPKEQHLLHLEQSSSRFTSSLFTPWFNGWRLDLEFRPIFSYECSSVLRPGSWQNMLFTQPACEVIGDIQTYAALYWEAERVLVYTEFDEGCTEDMLIEWFVRRQLEEWIKARKHFSPDGCAVGGEWPSQAVWEVITPFRRLVEAADCTSIQAVAQ